MNEEFSLIVKKVRLQSNGDIIIVGNHDSDEYYVRTPRQSCGGEVVKGCKIFVSGDVEIKRTVNNASIRVIPQQERQPIIGSPALDTSKHDKQMNKKYKSYMKRPRNLKKYQYTKDELSNMIYEAIKNALI